MTGIDQGANSIAFAFQTGLIVTALFVFLISGAICVGRVWKRQFDDVFWFSMSLSIVWFASLATKAWYAVWRYQHMKDPISPDWMIGHWVTVLLTGMFIIGGLLHIRYLTKHKFKEKGWKFSALVISSVMLVAYWVII